MKIGFLGNTNNYPFMLARAIRCLGHDVLFIIDREDNTKWDKLNRPENRYSDIRVPYPNWIYDASPFNFWYQFPPPSNFKKVINLLKSCDAVILNQHAPSLLHLIQRPAIVLLTGSDLEVLANLSYADEMDRQYYQKNIFLGRLKSRLKAKLKIFNKNRQSAYSNISLFNPYDYLNLVMAQRKGIRDANYVIYFPKGLLPVGDRLLKQIGVKDNKRICIRMTDLEKISLYPLPNNPIVRVFCVARLNWKVNNSFVYTSPLDYKGSDIMIKGLNLFYQRTKTFLDIRLVKKGNDVQETIELIEQLGLTSQVTWLNEMSQLKVLEEYKQADIIFENLGQGICGMGALDAMATGRPVIANDRPDLIEPITAGEPSPICQATNPEEVCQQLHFLVFNPEEREKIGVASRKYVEKYFSADRAAKLCLERLSQVVFF